MLALYFAPGSSAMAPHIALHEIGARFESRPLSFARQEHRAASYLAINPEERFRPCSSMVAPHRGGGHPVLSCAPLSRSRSAADGDIEAEAQILSWMSFLASTIHPARRQGIEQARVAYGLADQRLGSGEWAVGKYSIADIHLFRLFWRFRNAACPEPSEFLPSRLTTIA
ncbi:glutathione S-transferase family protein [Siccirubricoccus deserti]